MKNVDCKIRNNEKAFTLIETLIYMVFIVLVMGLFTDFGVRVVDLRNKIKVMRLVSATASDVLDVAGDEVKQSALVLEPVANATSSRLVYLREAGGAQVAITNENGIVSLTEAGHDPVRLTSADVSIQNLVFTNLSPTNKRASILMNIKADYRSSNNGGVYSYPFELESVAGQR